MSTDTSRKSSEQLPSWLIPLFAFFAGVAITAAVLMPSALTPEFQRGFAAGFREGRVSNDAGWQASVNDSYRNGYEEGRKSVVP